MNKLRHLDLFSGIGGFALGLERTGGFCTVGFCEINEFCRKVLRKHWSDVPCHHDVREMQFDEPFDIITGGFPCQDLSLAGQRAGIAGERSGLYREIVRALRLVRPKYAVMENVAALLGNGMGSVCGDLAEIRYDAEWHCIPAGAINCAHERDRIWIIANAPGFARFHKPYCGEIKKRLPDHCSSVKARLKDAPTPAVCRVDDEIPDRVDRTEALGNSVVPQIPKLIGHAILEAEGMAA